MDFTVNTAYKKIIKKLLLIVMVGLCMGIGGCGSQDKSQYNEQTNQKVSVYGIDFQVPEVWKKTYENEEYLEYSETKHNGDYKNLLGITFNQGMKLNERTAEVKYGLEFATKKYGTIENLKQSNILIAGMPATKIEYAQKNGHQQGNGTIVLLQTKKGVIEIAFYSPGKIGHDDFAKVLDSITKTKQ